MNFQPTAQESKPSASSGQNLPLGFAAGIGTMIIGIALWSVVAQKFQVTWMSLVVAFGIASAMKYLGKPKDMWVGIVSAFLSLIAAISGNLATIIFMAAKNYKKTPMEILANLDPGTAVMYLSKYTGFLGIIFYAMTAYVGFWFSFTHVPKRLPMDD